MGGKDAIITIISKRKQEEKMIQSFPLITAEKVVTKKQMRQAGEFLGKETIVHRCHSV